MIAQATITMASAIEALTAIDAARAAGDHVVDLSGCTQFDSALITVLLESRRRSQAAGAAFSVSNVPQNLRKLAALYGVEEMLLGSAAKH